MATFVICAVRDAAIEAYNQPFFVPALGAAIRGFGDEVNRVGSDMNKHPEDFELYELGVFSDSDARLTMLDVPRRVVRGTDALVKAKE